jgi:hypothetical protein
MATRTPPRLSPAKQMSFFNPEAVNEQNITDAPAVHGKATDRTAAVWLIRARLQWCATQFLMLFAVSIVCLILPNYARPLR